MLAILWLCTALGADPAVPDADAPAAAAPAAAPLAEELPGVLPLDEEASAAVVIPAAQLPRLVPERWTLPAELVAAVRAVADKPLGQRIAVASEPFLGLPYVNDAAGEGTVEDPDPPSRYDAFDCLTFVEEILAITLAADPLSAPQVRDALRYAGPPSYANRRHFMEAEWVPAAIANGLLEDITARVGHARTLRHVVTPAVWAHWRHRRFFKLPDARLPVGEWTLPFLDLAEVERVAADIPPGALVLTLRVARSYVPIVVTHVSMVVPTADGVRMRHATRMGTQRVRDDRLDWYLTHLRDYTRWPSLGVTILMPREQGPRRAALVGPVLPSAPLAPAEGELPTFVPRPIAPFPPVAARPGEPAPATPVNAVLWDLDGTLVDSVADISAAANRTLEHFGLPPLSAARVRRNVGHGARNLVETCVRDAGGTFADAQLSWFLDDYRRHPCDGTAVYPGLPELLARIGAPMAVVTNKPEDISRAILAQLGLARFFPVVIGGETLAARKPDPLPVRTALRWLGATGGVLIGDAPPDVGAGRAAGLPVIGVDWGIGVPEGADVRVDSVPMLEAELSRMGFLAYR